jgi:hypothetical protein
MDRSFAIEDATRDAGRQIRRKGKQKKRENIKYARRVVRLEM